MPVTDTGYTDRGFRFGVLQPCITEDLPPDRIVGLFPDWPCPILFCTGDTEKDHNFSKTLEITDCNTGERYAADRPAVSVSGLS